MNVGTNNNRYIHIIYELIYLISSKTFTIVTFILFSTNRVY